ncbi:MAG: D-hexose-6-phosphate mutarotase [Microbacteriaceae bacterium]|nr:D-hexose-6-phosphate mutarotase [Microbacteriaceae bacterium]
MNSHHAATLPSSVTVTEGRGGLPMLRVRATAGEADVYLQGAQVTSWNPSGQAPVLWVSAASRFERNAPIRGGIPLCFPWFGPHPTGRQHGWARTSEWTLAEADEVGDDVRLILVLRDSEETRSSAWPHRFEARYEVLVGASLRVALSVTNLSDDTIDFTEALHTYLAVSDVRNVAVTGLENLPFVEGSSGGTQDAEPLRFTEPITRIFTGATGVTVVADTDRSILIETGNAANTVVWNPWDVQAASMADFGDEEWQQMLCVETANVAPSRVTLPAGATHEIVTTIALSARSRVR